MRGTKKGSCYRKFSLNFNEKVPSALQEARGRKYGKIAGNKIISQKWVEPSSVIMNIHIFEKLKPNHSSFEDRS